MPNLPPEIITRIIQELGARSELLESIQPWDLRVCRLVSRSWNGAALDVVFRELSIILRAPRTLPSLLDFVTAHPNICAHVDTLEIIDGDNMPQLTDSQGPAIYGPICTYTCRDTQPLPAIFACFPRLQSVCLGNILPTHTLDSSSIENTRPISVRALELQIPALCNVSDILIRKLLSIFSAVDALRTRPFATRNFPRTSFIYPVRVVTEPLPPEPTSSFSLNSLQLPYCGELRSIANDTFCAQLQRLSFRDNPKGRVVPSMLRNFMRHAQNSLSHLELPDGALDSGQSKDQYFVKFAYS